MLGHQFEDLYEDLFEVRDAKWKNEEINRDVSALFLFLPLKFFPSNRHIYIYNSKNNYSIFKNINNYL